MKKMMMLMALAAFAGVAMYSLTPGRHDAETFKKSVNALKQASSESAAALAKTADAGERLVESAGNAANHGDTTSSKPSAAVKSASSDYAKSVADATQRRDAQAEALTALKAEATDFAKKWSSEIDRIKDPDLREQEHQRFARTLERTNRNIARANAALQGMNAALERAADVELVARSIANETAADQMALSIDRLGNDVTLATNEINSASAQLLAGLDFEPETAQTTPQS